MGLSNVNRDRAQERAERLLAEDLQQVIRRHILRQHYTTVDLARLLEVEPETAQSFMQRQTWQLGFCMMLIGTLDIPVKATGTKIRM